MSYNNYSGYPNYYYGNRSGYNYSSSHAVSPLSGLTVNRKKREQEQKQKCLLATAIILFLLLIAAIIAVVWLYLTKDTGPTPTASPDNSTTPGVSFIDVNVTATRQDVTYGPDYADENQNGYQSLSQTTCYQISQTAVPDYIVTTCTTTDIRSSQTTGVDIFLQLTVFIQNQTPEKAITGLATTLAGIAEPLAIDASNVILA